MRIVCEPPFLVASLLERFGEVTVDRKAVKDDRFVDLAVRHGSRYVKRRFKSGDDPGLFFKLADLVPTWDSLG